MSSSVFETLANQLSQTEKKELLGKIRGSINLEQKDNDSIVPVMSNRQEMEARFRHEITRMGFFGRLWLNILSFFTGKSNEYVYFQRKIKSLQNQVNSSMTNVINFERGLINEKMARRVYDLFYQANDLKNLFRSLFKDDGPMEMLVSVLLEQKIPNVKKELFDILSRAEFEKVYKNTGEKTSLKKKLFQNLDQYIKKIPNEIWEEVGLILQPVYYLKFLVLYPYALLLDSFGHNPGDLPLQKYPTFRECSLKTGVEFLERLYYALHLAYKTEYDREKFEKILDTLQQLEKDIMPSDGLKNIKELLDEARDVFREVPIIQILRAYYEDPYFKLQFYVPEFKIREFYGAALRLKFSAMLEEFFPKLRQEIIESQKESLFQEQNAVYLEHYVHMHEVPLEQFGLRGFRHVESVNLLYSFLRNHMPVQITPLIQTVSRVLLQNDKRLLTKILSSNQSLDDLKNQIETFDMRIGPTGDEGEVFKQIKMELGDKVTSHKLFTNFVQKQDETVLRILVQARAKLSELKNLLLDISGSKKPSQKKILDLPFLQGGLEVNLGQALHKRSETLEQFGILLKETMDIEQEKDL